MHWTKSLSLLFTASTFAAPLQDGPTNFTLSASYGEPWQIILSGRLYSASGLTPSVNVWDVDLFNTDQSIIQSLKAQGKTVICYFSAGTSEQNRPDMGRLRDGDIGNELKDWPGEHWLNLRSSNVFSIMQARIALAASKGCDAVDPDNMDGYQEGQGGLGLSTGDSVAFVQKMASVARQYGLGIGLKNSIDILSSVANDVQFAVNEQCAALSECGGYEFFLNMGKPVLNIEYSEGYGTCADRRMNTVIKTMSLDGYVKYCDGSQYTTPTASAE